MNETSPDELSRVLDISGINLCCSIQLRHLTHLFSVMVMVGTVLSVFFWSQGGFVTAREKLLKSSGES